MPYQPFDNELADIYDDYEYHPIKLMIDHWILCEHKWSFRFFKCHANIKQLCSMESLKRKQNRLYYLGILK